MRHILILLSILLFSSIFISCSKSSDDGSKSTDTTPPTVSSSSPSDGDTSVSITSNVSVTFSETMDTSSVTTNTLDTTCFGTFQVSSDGFTTCIIMSSSPTSSNSDKTFTITPKDNFLPSTVYRIRITTGTKDSSGNSLTSQWSTSSGFQTGNWTKQLGSPSIERGDGVTTDSSDNIYVTGYTYGGLDGNTNSGITDIFLVKYNSSGTKQWTKQFGTSSVDVGRGVTTDSSDNIYVTGYTDGGLDNKTWSMGDDRDIFLVKYNSSGTK